MRRKTTEEFIKQANQKFNSTFNYSKTKYVDALTKVIITCNIHGDFEQRPADHLSGKGGCKECSKVTKHTTESFKKKAIVIHKNYYDYSKVTFKDINDKVSIICPKHGDFLQVARNHLTGAGCKKCGIESSTKVQTKSLKVFIEQANKVHLNKYSYLNVVYKNNAEKIHIECKDHGPFWQVPNDHLKGRGCPTCGQTLKRSSYKDKSTLLYYVKFSNNVYKIGIARSTLPQRFKGCKKPEIIKLYRFKDGAVAFDLEHQIMRENKDKKYNGKYFINNYNTSCGESECFIDDISESIDVILKTCDKTKYIKLQ